MSQINVIPTSERGVMIPESSAVLIANDVIKTSGLTGDFQRVYEWDKFLDLGNKDRVRMIAFTTGEFLLTGTSAPCEEGMTKGGISTVYREIEVCNLSHYGELCLDEPFVDCLSHLLNDFTNQRQPSEAANAIVGNVIEQHAMQLLDDLKGMLALGSYWTPKVESGEITAESTDCPLQTYENWVDMQGRCKGWLACLKENCDVFKAEDFEACSTTQEQTTYLHNAFTALKCCAQAHSKELKRGLTRRLMMGGRRLMPYIRVTPALYTILEDTAVLQGAQMANGCTNVCDHSFTYMANNAYDSRQGRAIYWSGYPIIVDEYVAAFDDFFGIETIGAWFAIEGAIQYTMNFGTINTNDIPRDYIDAYTNRNYDRPVLAIYPDRNKNGNHFKMQAHFRAGANVLNELIAGSWIHV